MHELSVVLEIIKTVGQFAAENEVGRIETLVLQIGELSSVIPKYVEACYPAAVDGTILEGSELKIDVLQANARCKECGKVYHAPDTRGVCPSCGSKEAELLSGREFFIKEIVVVE
jgi:hydrogenase nickel incorporation protein HypA/HybF